MTDEDPLFFWRLAEHLSVEDAAILIAGGDPSTVDVILDGPPIVFEDAFSANEIEIKRTTGHPGFVPVFTSLKNAIRQGNLKSQLQYKLHHRDRIGPEEQVWVLPRAFVTDPKNFEVDFASIDFGDEDRHCIAIEKEPDWSATLIDVRDLKAWLSERGLKSGFFFPTSEADPDEFMDQAHEHFAPELALAVAAWRALAKTQKFRSGTKAAIEAWINQNPKQWRSDSELSNSAKERIVTVANWNRIGGATPSGG